MKIAFIRHYHYVSDENSSGRPGVPRLPSNIFLAASYCQQLGFNVTVLSLLLDSDFRPENYDVVVVYVPLLEGFDRHIRYLEMAKIEGKVTICVLNDPFDTIEMEMMGRFPFIDVTVRLNERELVIGKLLDILKKDGRLENINFPGVIFRDENERLVDTGIMAFAGSLEHLPSTVPLLEKENYKLYEHLFIEVGRGCPFKCSFCFYRVTGHRTRKIQDVLNEMKYAQGKFKFVWLHDLNMLADKDYAMRLSQAIINSGIQVIWGTDGRIELCNDIELLGIMKRAGCARIALGLESGSTEILESIQKGRNLHFLDRALKNLADVGIEPEMNLMIGYPGEDSQSLRCTIEMARKYRVSFIQYVRPLRGTPLYDQYKSFGLIKEDLTIDDYRNARYYPMFPTLYLNKEELVRGRRSIAAPSEVLLFIARIKALLRKIKYGFWMVHAIATRTRKHGESID